MTCPAGDVLLLDELGELPVNQSARVRAHLDDCVACRNERAELQQMLRDLGPRSPAGPLASGATASAEAFVSRVEMMARSAATGPARPALERPAWRRWALPVISSVGAALALTLVVVRNTSLDRLSGGARSEPVIGIVAPRGSPATRSGLEPRLGAELLLTRGDRLQPLAGEVVRASDVLALRVTNLSGRTVHMMAFGRDAAGDVHWLYPEYGDARTNPSSLAIKDGVADRVLDEVVQPEAPARGPMQFVTVISADPLTVKDVEARLARQRAGPGIAALFPGATVREWTAFSDPTR